MGRANGEHSTLSARQHRSERKEESGGSLWNPLNWYIIRDFARFFGGGAEDRRRAKEVEREANDPNRILRAGDSPTAGDGKSQLANSGHAVAIIKERIRETATDGVTAVAGGVIIGLSGPYRAIRIEKTAGYGAHMHLTAASGGKSYISFTTLTEATSQLPNSLRNNPKIIRAIKNILRLQ